MNPGPVVEQLDVLGLEVLILLLDPYPLVPVQGVERGIIFLLQFLSCLMESGVLHQLCEADSTFTEDGKCHY